MNKEINKPLDSFYKLYRKGRTEKKVPVGYIDYFEARKFLLDKIQSAVKERDEYWKMKIEKLDEVDAKIAAKALEIKGVVADIQARLSKPKTS